MILSKLPLLKKTAFAVKGFWGMSTARRKISYNRKDDLCDCSIFFYYSWMVRCVCAYVAKVIRESRGHETDVFQGPSHDCESQLECLPPQSDTLFAEM